MNKNKIILYIAILLILIAIILIVFNKIEKNSSIDETNNVIIENVTNSDGYYTIYNKETNEIIAENIPREQILLYEDNPDYNPTGM